MTRRRVASLLLALTATVLVTFGPDWPARVTELSCASEGAFVEKGVFDDMRECTLAMAQEANGGGGCSCAVIENRWAPLYYLALVPLLVVGATWMANAATARGMGAVVIVVAIVLLIPAFAFSRMYAAGIPIPNLLAGLAIGGSQLVFFGPSMSWVDPGGGLVLPYRWAHLATAAFWLLAALGFGLLTRRLRSLPLLTVLAAVFVALVSIALKLIAPLLNVRVLMESL